MPDRPGDRNRHVEVRDDDNAPEAPDVGVAIQFGVNVDPEFPVGKPIHLYGTAQGDNALLKLCGGQLTTAVLLTLIRTDKTAGETAVLMQSDRRPGAGPEPDADVTQDEDYREAVSFRVDLAAFFDLPKEPGTYTIEAAIGPHFSGREELEIVQPK